MGTPWLSTKRAQLNETSPNLDDGAEALSELWLNAVSAIDLSSNSPKHLMILTRCHQVDLCPIHA